MIKTKEVLHHSHYLKIQKMFQMAADVDFPVAQTETENTALDTDIDGEMDTDVEASSSREGEGNLRSS